MDRQVVTTVVRVQHSNTGKPGLQYSVCEVNLRFSKDRHGWWSGAIHSLGVTMALLNSKLDPYSLQKNTLFCKKVPLIIKLRPGANISTNILMILPVECTCIQI